MKHLLATVAVIGIAVLPSPVQAAPRFEDTVERFLSAETRFDPAAMAAFMAPDYTEISPVGDLDTRQAVLSFYAPEHWVPVTLSPQERLASHDDVTSSVVCFRLTFRFRPPGQKEDTPLVERVMIGSFAGRLRRNGTGETWEIVHAQYTPVRPAAHAR